MFVTRDQLELDALENGPIQANIMDGLERTEPHDHSNPSPESIETSLMALMANTSLPQAGPHHHHPDADQEHEQADAVDAVHEAQAQVRVRLLEQGERVQVVGEALPEHGVKLAHVQM